METIVSVMVNVGWFLLALVVLILFDVCLAVALALKNGTFEWVKLGEFYKSSVGPYLIPWFFMSVFVDGLLVLFPPIASRLGAEAQGILSTVSAGILWLFVITKVIASIRGHIVTLYGELLIGKKPEARGEEA